MTILDLDPPPALRLVSSTGSTERDDRYRTSSPLFGDARELYREFLEHGLATQRVVCPDSLRIVLAAKQATSPAPIRSFTAGDIWQLLFVDVVAWCRNRKLDMPSRCVVSLDQLVDYLELTGTFAAPSDPVDDLRDAIDECTGGWFEDHPSTSEPSSLVDRARRSLPSKRGKKRT